MNSFSNSMKVIDYSNTATFDALCEFAKRDEEIKTWERGDKKTPKPSRVLLCVNEDKITHRISIKAIDEKKIGFFEKLKITLLGSCRLSKVLAQLNASLGIISNRSASRKLSISGFQKKRQDQIGQFKKALNLLLNKKVSSHNEKLKKISVFSKKIELEKYDALKKIAGLVEGFE